MRLIKCPICGESYYRIKYSIKTAAYYPPIYQNGININPDQNLSTTYCQCEVCGNSFDYRMKGDKLINKYECNNIN